MTAVQENQNTDLSTVVALHSPESQAKTYELVKQKATELSNSDLVPSNYRGKQANCLVALNMAHRLNTDPMMVMQNLYIVHGNPAWSSQFMIATFNKSGKFGSLRYEFFGHEGQDDWGCRASATDLLTEEKIEGPLITIALAKAEKWYGKSGSKWQTMPEMMLRYRAAAWFIRTVAPEIALGLQSVEEMDDVYLPRERKKANAVTTDELKGDNLSGTNDDIEDAEIVEDEFITPEESQERIANIVAVENRQDFEALMQETMARLSEVADSPLRTAVGKAFKAKQEELQSQRDAQSEETFPGDLPEGESLE